MNVRGWLLPVAGACLVALALSDVTAAQARPQAQDLFNRYRSGETSAVLAEIDALTAPQLDVLLRDLRRRLGQWVRDGGETAAVRLDAAVFLLDLAATRMERDWQAVRDLVELGCRFIEPLGTSDERVRQWHLASVALAQGAADVRFLIGASKVSAAVSFDHLAHSQLKLPDEPRLRLATLVLTGMGRTDLAPPRDQPWATDAELQSRPGVARSEVTLRAYRRTMLQDLEALESIPAIAQEVHLRAAHVSYLNHDDAVALAHLDAAAGSGDVFIDYVALLLRAMIAIRRQDAPFAEATLRRAVALVPSAQSSVGLLSSQLFLTGRHQEAQDLIEVHFANRGASMDPWRLFGYGDFRRLPELLTSLRAGVGR